MSEIAAPVEVQYAYRFEYADKSAFVVYPDGRAFITFPEGRAPEQKFGKIDNRIPALIGQAAKPRQDEIERLREQLVSAHESFRKIRTSYCGYAITKSEQYPEVLADFWKEIQRMDKIARSALTDDLGNSK